TFVESFCPECENMLLTGSHFCIVCGTSVRSSSHQARRTMGAPGESPSSPSDTGAATTGGAS
ncbi:zinc-ribbon domain-containing protein, partial [Nocardioides sp.]|uniref:zinc-ribbon domain-containing protein n=1 Tax=Nocardioides sp. TaxID=35761 RepID=UPI0027599225|nr:hypothetical protein [Nocardioides sp.]